MIPVTFRAFRAVDEPETCLRFIQGHKKVLEAYGITMITSNTAAWTTHANTTVILAESAEGTALGGVRLQVADAQMALPIEDAVGNVDPRIHEVIRRHEHHKIAEACGLWNAREVAGLGLSFSLLRAAIAVGHLLNIQSIFALAAPVTVNMCLQAGFLIERSLGKDGFFNYPKLDLVATAMVIENLETMQHASEEDRARIFSLRNNPDTTFMELGPKGKTLVHYKLSL